MDALKHGHGLAAVAGSEDYLVAHDVNFYPAASRLVGLSNLATSRVKPRTRQSILDEAEKPSLRPLSLLRVKPQVFDVLKNFTYFILALAYFLRAQRKLGVDLIDLPQSVSLITEEVGHSIPKLILNSDERLSPRAIENGLVVTDIDSLERVRHVAKVIHLEHVDQKRLVAHHRHDHGQSLPLIQALLRLEPVHKAKHHADVVLAQNCFQGCGCVIV